MISFENHKGPTACACLDRYNQKKAIKSIVYMKFTHLCLARDIKNDRKSRYAMQTIQTCAVKNVQKYFQQSDKKWNYSDQVNSERSFLKIDFLFRKSIFYIFSF